MGILRVDHPDILDFIALKQQPGELTNFIATVGVENDQLASHRDDEGRRRCVFTGTRVEQRIDRVSLRQPRTTSMVLFPRTILLSRHPYQIELC